MKYLLDTNIISELKKKTPDQNVVNWFEGIDTDELYLSCITIGELKSGALKKAKTDIIFTIKKKFSEKEITLKIGNYYKLLEFVKIKNTTEKQLLLRKKWSQ